LKGGSPAGSREPSCRRRDGRHRPRQEELTMGLLGLILLIILILALLGFFGRRVY
jgi:hypothetical protein